VSPVRVSQVLTLLNLHPIILGAIRALPPGTPNRRLTERRLRPLTRLPQDQQGNGQSGLLVGPATPGVQCLVKPLEIRELHPSERLAPFIT
jgi:hypothetical protein